LLKEKAGNLKGDLKKEISELNGVNFLAKKIDLDTKGIKDLAHELGGELDNLFLFFGSENNGKATLTCYISKELVASKELHAGTIVRELGKHIQGGGGGQPFFATAGGKNPAGLELAIDAVKTYLN
jgi:alanyl-tRNA synthetase